MTTYFKAVRPDGTSFNDPTFAWATEPGGVTNHQTAGEYRETRSSAAEYLSVSTTPTDCTGMLWPCRLLVVEAAGLVWVPDADGLPNKRAGLSFITVEERPAHEALGPQGEHVAALIERFGALTAGELHRLDAAGAAAWDAAWAAARAVAWAAAPAAARAAAWDAAWDATWDAAGAAAWDAARDAAWDAASALVVRDLITAEHYDALTRPWRTVIGRIHPDDEEVTT